MKKFKFTAKNETSTKLIEGEIVASNIVKASKEIKEFCSVELNTPIKEITIHSLQEIN